MGNKFMESLNDDFFLQCPIFIGNSEIKLIQKFRIFVKQILFFMISPLTSFFSKHFFSKRSA